MCRLQAVNCSGKKYVTCCSEWRVMIELTGELGAGWGMIGAVFVKGNSIWYDY